MLCVSRMLEAGAVDDNKFWRMNAGPLSILVAAKRYGSSGVEKRTKRAKDYPRSFNMNIHVNPGHVSSMKSSLLQRGPSALKRSRSATTLVCFPARLSRWTGSVQVCCRPRSFLSPSCATLTPCDYMGSSSIVGRAGSRMVGFEPTAPRS